MECLVEKKYYWGPSLELSLCRYKYINLIKKDLTKINLTPYEINSLIQCDIRDVSYSIIDYDDIILPKNKILYINYNNNISNKIITIFKHYTNLFLQEIIYLNKNPQALININKNNNDIFQLYILNNSSTYINTPIFNVNKKIIIRLIFLFIKINKNIIINKNLILNNIYHLLLLYNTIGINWSHIKEDGLNLLSSPIVKIYPFTYCSFFPFIERIFGSCGYYKSKIIIKKDLIINLYNLNINIIKNINILSNKRNNNIILFNNRFKKNKLLKIENINNNHNCKSVINNIKLNYKIIKFK